MSEICCGESRESRYCPNCGRVLIEDPGLAILTHFRHQLRQAQKEMQDCQREPHREVIQRKERLVAKWKTWVAWVEKHAVPVAAT